MKTDVKLWIIMIAIPVSICVAAIIGRLNARRDQPVDAERILQNAAALESRGLYKDALNEYDRYRTSAALTREQEADLLYKMAKIADENMSDCERALPYYTMATTENGQASWASEAGRRTVACLEKQGKSSQAQSLLVQLTGPATSATAGSAPAPAPSGPVVAVVDGRSVRWGEVEAALKPQAGATALSNPEKRKQLLHGYVFSLMAGEEAKRQGLETDPDLKAFLAQARREALAEFYLRRELKDQKDQTAVQELWKKLTGIHQARVFDDAIPAP